MRRRAAALAVSLLALGLVFVNPWQATADHCNRVIVFTGFTASGVNNPTSGQPAGLRPNAGAFGCLSTAAHANTNRITPGSNSASVRVLQGAKDPLPASGTLTIADKTIELELKGDNDDPSKASQFNSQFVPIEYSKVDKIVATVVFADGSEQKTTYTK